MSLEELLKKRREEVRRICAPYGAQMRVFGSVARGEAAEDSDVDLRGDFEPGRSLLDHAGLALELEELLGRKGDVGMEDGLSWLLRRPILRGARAL